MHPRQPAPVLPLLLVALLTSSLAAQVLVDFGPVSRPSAGGPVHWNDVPPGAPAAPIQLVDTAGFPAGITLSYAAGKHFANGGTGGTTTAGPGSALAGLGWPSSAFSDYLWGSGSSSSVVVILGGLDTGAVYDLTLFTSRMSVSDVRTTEYAVQGAARTAVVLDAALNQGKVVTVTGMAPAAGGQISITIRAASTNTSAGPYFYLGAMGITVRGGSPQPPRLAFFPGRLDVSRPAGSPVFRHDVQVAASTAATPGLTLTARDDATGKAPTWLTLPATATAGTPFTFGLGGASLATGTYRATLTASATGFQAASGTVTLTVRPAGGRLNLLWYGNSFTMGNGTVSDAMRLLAMERGEPEPVTVTRLAGGRNLYFHLTDPHHAGAITGGLPLGETWDFVILQGHSVEATVTLGNRTAFIANAAAILKNVRAHSPCARAILFQTWARAVGHTYYQGSTPLFQGPLDMHAQVEEGTRLAVEGINRTFGPDSGRRAAAGETALLSGFAPAIYASDLYHAGPPITLMSAVAIYSAIYGKRVSGHTPDFQGSSQLVARLKGWGMAVGDWWRYAGLADRVAAPGVRAYPGSGEDLLLRTGVAATPTAVPLKAAARGQGLRVDLASPAGSYGTAPALLVLSWFPTGSPFTPPAGWPEVHFGLSTWLPLGASGSLSTLNWQAPLLTDLKGWSLLFQGVAVQPSAKTRNPLFTTTDAHEVRVK